MGKMISTLIHEKNEKKLEHLILYVEHFLVGSSIGGGG